MERFSIDPGVAREVCDRLGLELPRDEAQIITLYQRWCELVPFDPIGKAAALVEGRVPPGGDADAFCTDWLEYGLGGTCWGHVAGLSAILSEVGVETTVALDRMVRHDAIDFHAFLVLRLSTRKLAMDLVHPSLVPLPIEPGATGSHPVYRTGFEADGWRLRHWFTHPDSFGSGTYNLLSTELDPDDVRAYCAVSAQFSGVRARSLFHKRVPPDGIVKARPGDDGRSLVVRRWTVSGEQVERIQVTDLDEAFAALGYGTHVRRLAERGGLVTSDEGGPRFRLPG